MTSSIAEKNTGRKCLLLLSTAAELGLFLSHSLYRNLIIAVIFLALAAVAVFGRVNSDYGPLRLTRGFRELLILLFSFAAFYSFVTSWMSNRKIREIAASLGKTPPRFLHTAGFIGILIGFYAVCTWSGCAAALLAGLLKNHFSEEQEKQTFSNIKRNCILVVSAAAFYLGWSFYYVSPFYKAVLVIPVLASLLYSAVTPSLWKYIRNISTGIHIVSLLSTAGICLFYKTVYIFAGSFFIYFCLLVFWKCLTELFINLKIFNGITKAEWIIYGVILILFLVLMTVSFAKTGVFYDSANDVDVIYTSDSPGLLKYNAFLSLREGANDLRQPMFAVFAAPFTAVPYLISTLVGRSQCIQAVLMNIIQIVLLFVIDIMLSKMMELNPLKRTCFILLTACSYTQFLFSLMIEQYIVACFWLVLSMCIITGRNNPDRFAMCAAGGTLLTSMALLPFMSDKSPVKSFKLWFADIVKMGLEYLAFLMAFCRFDVFFDVILNLRHTILVLTPYTGKTLLFTDKLYQYSAFIRNCFLAPNAGVNDTSFVRTTWQLNPVTGLNIPGILIFILAVVSVIVNRKKKSSLMAGWWIGLSIVVLLLFGWGTQENGLILYSLYFGWAFLMLIFQLLEKIEQKLKVKYLIPALSICLVVLFLIINIPAVKEIIDFGIAYYPAI